METNRNRSEQTDPTSTPNHTTQPHQNRGSANGFEGMNFEEQRSSYKNSDGAGVKDPQKGSRNGTNDRQDQ
jgi:hypothetical protein